MILNVNKLMFSIRIAFLRFLCRFDSLKLVGAIGVVTCELIDVGATREGI